MEYDIVDLADDFIREKDIIKKLEDEDSEPCDKEMIKEEINILYVGLTRAKNKLSVGRSVFKEVRDILK
jgi:ATP-dependent exoDNAse (exonuclease V) beta subunit